MKRLLVASAFLIGCTASANAWEADIKIPYDYRSWFHFNSLYDTGANGDFFNGLVNVYLNPYGVFALPSVSRGRPYPDGTVFVLDQHNAVPSGTPGSSANNTFWDAGQNKTLVAIMVKDSRLFDSQTGHWGFQAYASSARPTGRKARRSRRKTGARKSSARL
jgi:Cytochrome P460